VKRDLTFEEIYLYLYDGATSIFQQDILNGYM